MELWAMKRREAQRAAAEAVEAEERPLEAGSPDGFTGLAWDQRRGVWVRWVNGRACE
jgi:hypothetical protein